jgi:hypothetical protein
MGRVFYQASFLCEVLARRVPGLPIVGGITRDTPKCRTYDGLGIRTLPLVFTPQSMSWSRSTTANNFIGSLFTTYPLFMMKWANEALMTSHKVLPAFAPYIVHLNLVSRVVGPISPPLCQTTRCAKNVFGTGRTTSNPLDFFKEEEAGTLVLVDQVGAGRNPESPSN